MEPGAAQIHHRQPLEGSGCPPIHSCVILVGSLQSRHSSAGTRYGQQPRGPMRHDQWQHDSSTWPRRDPSRTTRVLLPFAHATGLPSRQHPASAQPQLRARLLHPVAHFAGRRSSRVARQRSRRSATASRARTHHAPGCRAQRSWLGPLHGSQRASIQQHHHRPGCHEGHPRRDAAALEAAGTRRIAREG